MASALTTTTVLLVDDHALLRKGIRAVLEQHDTIRIVGEASNGLEAVQYARSLRPQIIIMDINMPHMDGVQATRLIKEEFPNVIIIGLSVNDAAFVRQALLQAGATAYLNKDQAGEDIYDTINLYMSRG
jgi:DNA-binding NarL/FixJ family response regulator